MKGKILTLIIGILIGAIVATIGFIVYNKVTEKNNNKPQTMMDGNFPQRPGNDANLSNEDENTNKKGMKGGMQEGNPNKQSNSNTATSNTSNLEINNNGNPPAMPNSSNQPAI